MPNINTLEVSAPIPGQSLTTELGSRPWERPAKYSDPEEALNYFLNKLNDSETLGTMLQILESGFPVTDLVDALTIGAVMQGLVSIDTAIIISPAIFELISSVAKNTEIEFSTGLNSRTSLENNTMMERAYAKKDLPETQDLLSKEEIEKFNLVAEKNIKQRDTGLMGKSNEMEIGA
jgi:hypothetical protein